MNMNGGNGPQWTTYHATPHAIGYVTHDEFIELVIDVQPLNRARNNDWSLTDV